MIVHGSPAVAKPGYRKPRHVAAEHFNRAERIYVRAMYRWQRAEGFDRAEARRWSYWRGCDVMHARQWEGAK